MTNLEEWLKELYDAAEAYLAIHEVDENYWVKKEFPDSERTYNLIFEISLLSFKQIYPLILSFKPYKFTSNENYKKMNNVLLKLINYLFRTIIVKDLSPSHIEGYIYELVSNNINGISYHILEAPLIKKESSLRKEFLSALYKPSFEQNNVFKFIQHRYLYLQQGTDGIKIEKNLELEHIFPQTPSKEWENIKEWKGILDDNDKKRLYIYNLGNVTLITKSKNKTAKNDVWSKKKVAYAKNNKLFTLNLDNTLVEFYDKDEILPIDILERSKKCIEFLDQNKTFSLGDDYSKNIIFNFENNDWEFEDN
ncbi:HNH endonuclease family protein [Spiroplasma sp. SV19]|uniref:HNH endonuclease family protein n=1 Tax=Spiroplasma sp. SV19 TaxID=2570468 RepID=UPI0024B72338|nr:HNH endonuclease family protein [Spiroplasma sp. SV19]